jgi:signal transduction histidine kinase
MKPDNGGERTIEVLLIAEDEERSRTVRQLVQLVLPRASITPVESPLPTENEVPPADVALIDGGVSTRATLDTLRFLRARGFNGGAVILLGTDDGALRMAAQSLGAECIIRSEAERSPVELGVMLTRSMAEGSSAVAEVAQARRVFAAGQAALSLQHSINNPLAALLAEAQLLELEELPKEQREAVGRMIELCRRIVALVRQLDALASR